eukprot:1294873-Amorphochlora_amoeboformis.AAC.3
MAQSNSKTRKMISVTSRLRRDPIENYSLKIEDSSDHKITVEDCLEISEEVLVESANIQNIRRDARDAL